MVRRIGAYPGGPSPGGHYSHAVVANGFVFVSGQVPVDPATGAVPDGFADQVRRALRNLEAALAAAGAGLGDVVKVTAYLADGARFDEYDAVYREVFPTEPPARTTVEAGLMGLSVEIDCIAALPDRPS